MVVKTPCGNGKVRVTFSMPAAIWADTIHVVGDFNDWNETATPLRLTEVGWYVTIELASGRSYQYRYLMNSRDWHNDWQADSYVPNEYGGDNSVVTLVSLEEPPAEVYKELGAAPTEVALEPHMLAFRPHARTSKRLSFR